MALELLKCTVSNSGVREDKQFEFLEFLELLDAGARNLSSFKVQPFNGCDIPEFPEACVCHPEGAQIEYSGPICFTITSKLPNLLDRSGLVGGVICSRAGVSGKCAP